MRIAVGMDAIMNASTSKRYFLTESDKLVRTTEIEGFEPTVFDTRMFDLVVGLRGILCPIYKGEHARKKYRLKLNEVEFAICIFAVRLAGKMSKQDPAHHTLATPRFTTTLLRNLEKYRKRCKRKTVLQFSAAAYESTQKEWRELQRAIRGALNAKTPDWLKAPSRRRYYRNLVTAFTPAACRGLTKNGYREPPPRELRKLIGMALRQIRRHRTRVGIPDLDRNPEVAEAFFCEFIASRYSRWEGQLKGVEGGKKRAKEQMQQPKQT